MDFKLILTLIIFLSYLLLMFFSPLIYDKCLKSYYYYKLKSRSKSISKGSE